MIRAILACDENWGIGKSGTLPWPHNSADLRWFKRCTSGHTVVMGRTTWESLPIKPLPNRRNIVITSTNFDGDAMYCYLQWFLANHMFLGDYDGSKDLWIIGGAKLFESTLDIVDEVWLSNINGNYDCDVFLPKERVQQQFAAGSISDEDGLTITKWVRR
jgi:dihydrofolate reductase